MKVKVTDVDNRGDREHPYGYVYFSDSNRVLFGDGARGYGPYGITSSNWGEVSQSPYFEIAETAIREHLKPKTVEPVETDDDDDDDDCPGGCGNVEDDCSCECDTCGCSTNEFVPGCDCDNGQCPAGCGA